MNFSFQKSFIRTYLSTWPQDWDESKKDPKQLFDARFEQQIRLCPSIVKKHHNQSYRLDVPIRVCQRKKMADFCFQKAITEYINALYHKLEPEVVIQLKIMATRKGSNPHTQNRYWRFMIEKYQRIALFTHTWGAVQNCLRTQASNWD